MMDQDLKTAINRASVGLIVFAVTLATLGYLIMVG